MVRHAQGRVDYYKSEPPSIKSEREERTEGEPQAKGRKEGRERVDVFTFDTFFMNS